MKKILLIITLLCPLLGHGQKIKMRIANKLYDNLHFAEAIRHYEEIAEKHPDNFEAIEKLAHSYRRINDSKHAEQWYQKVVTRSESEPKDKLYYAESLAKNGKYDLAKMWYKKYADVVSADTRGKNFTEAYSNMQNFYKDSSNYKIEKIGINSSASDFSPFFFEENKLIFCSNRHNEVRKGKKRSFNWTKSSFLDLYVTEIDTADASNSESTPKLFNSTLNSKYHEGPIAFLEDGNKIIFTRNNYFKGKYKKSKDHINKLKMYIAEKSGDGWTNLTEFTHNNDEYSVGHPTVSHDGQWLYFASDMPGSIGGVDIYRCKIDGSSFGPPENLGKDFNTEGDEMFPHIDGEGNLYYSSTGLGGMGGLDIFMSIRDHEGNFDKPFNIGTPLNSSQDDFGLIFNSDKGYGYFTSYGRANGIGDDDIFKFYRKEVPRRTINIIAKTIKKDTEESLEGTSIEVKNLRTGEVQTYQSNPDGTFDFDIKQGDPYEIVAVKEDYEKSTVKLSDEETKSLKDGDIVSIPLNSIKRDLIADHNPSDPASKDKLKDDLDNFTKDDLGDLMMYNLYYDYNKYNIRPDAAATLEVLAELMNKFKDVNVTLRSHTDKRSTVYYNNWLSNKRAQAARNFLIRKGVNGKRIKITAAGKSEPVESCEDCDETQHQWNRRTEYTMDIGGEPKVRSQKPPKVIVGGKK